jgi:hypothetical protein
MRAQYTKTTASLYIHSESHHPYYIKYAIVNAPNEFKCPLAAVTWRSHWDGEKVTSSDRQFFAVGKEGVEREAHITQSCTAKKRQTSRVEGRAVPGKYPTLNLRPRPTQRTSWGASLLPSEATPCSS